MGETYLMIAGGGISLKLHDPKAAQYIGWISAQDVLCDMIKDSNNSHTYRPLTVCLAWFWRYQFT